jgi:hypothetical protein
MEIEGWKTLDSTQGNEIDAFKAAHPHVEIIIIQEPDSSENPFSSDSEDIVNSSENPYSSDSENIVNSCEHPYSSDSEDIVNSNSGEKFFSSDSEDSVSSEV